MQQNFETKRLRVRPLSLEDDQFILTLVNTDGWLKFIGDRQVRTVIDAKNYIAKINNNSQIYYSVFETKETNLPIGIVTLLYRDGLLFPDIGFAILPEFEKKGYTYEASQKYIEMIMENTTITTIKGLTLKENIASINLLEKLGLKYDGTFHKDDEELLMYSITKDE